MQLNDRMKSSVLKTCVLASFSAFSAFMVVARLLLGMHWLTDIIGGALISASLVLMYRFLRFRSKEVLSNSTKSLAIEKSFGFPKLFSML